MFCNACGHRNPDGAAFCSLCGVAMGTVGPGVVPPPVSPPGPSPVVPTVVSALKPSHLSDVGGSFDAEAFEALVGPKNTAYYLERFKRVHGGGSARWHWPAFFVTFYWLLYRKMWGWAALYFTTPYLIGLAAGFVAGMMGSEMAKWAPGLATLATILIYVITPPVVANHLYYKTLLKRMANAKVGASSRENYLGALRGVGGTSNAAAVVVGFVAFIGVIGILAAVSLPAYENYTHRAKFSEAASYARRVVIAVTETAFRDGVIDTQAYQRSGVPPMPRHVRDVKIDATDGTVYLTVDLSTTLSGIIAFTPQIDSSQSHSVDCSTTLPERVVPSSLRCWTSLK